MSKSNVSKNGLNNGQETWTHAESPKVKSTFHSIIIHCSLPSFFFVYFFSLSRFLLHQPSRRPIIPLRVANTVSLFLLITLHHFCFKLWCNQRRSNGASIRPIQSFCWIQPWLFRLHFWSPQIGILSTFLCIARMCFLLLSPWFYGSVDLILRLRNICL